MNPPNHHRPPEEVLIPSQNEEGDPSSKSIMTPRQGKIRTISVSSVTEAASASQEQHHPHPTSHHPPKPRLFPRHPLRTSSSAAALSSPESAVAGLQHHQSQHHQQRQLHPGMSTSSRPIGPIGPATAVTPASSAASSVAYRGRKRQAMSSSYSTSMNSAAPHLAPGNTSIPPGAAPTAPLSGSSVPVTMIAFSSAPSSYDNAANLRTIHTPQRAGTTSSNSTSLCSGGQRVLPAAYRTPSQSPAPNMEQQHQYMMTNPDTTHDNHNDDDSMMKPPLATTPLAGGGTSTTNSTHSAITTTSSSWLSTPQELPPHQHDSLLVSGASLLAKDSPSINSTNSGFLDGVTLQGLALHSSPKVFAHSSRKSFTHDGSSSPFATPFASPGIGSTTSWMTPSRSPPSVLETPLPKKAPLRILAHPSMVPLSSSHNSSGTKSRLLSTPPTTTLSENPFSKKNDKKNPPSFLVPSPPSERAINKTQNSAKPLLFMNNDPDDRPLPSVTLGHRTKTCRPPNKDAMNAVEVELPVETIAVESSAVSHVQSTPLSQADVSFIPLPNWNDDSPPTAKVHHKASTRGASMSLFRSDMPDPIDQLFAQEEAARNVDEESLSDDGNGEGGEAFLLVSPRDIRNDPMEHHEDERPTKHRRKCPPFEEISKSEQQEDAVAPLPCYDERRKREKPLPIVPSRDLITPPVMPQSLSPPPLLPNTYFQ